MNGKRCPTYKGLLRPPKKTSLDPKEHPKPHQNITEP